jgi:hypothetical protein
MVQFTPVTKASSSVKEDLRKAASDRKISVDELDFDLLSYETYYKRLPDQDWHPMHGNNLLTQITQEELYSSDFLLRQEYQIKIRPFAPHQYLDLQFSIAMSKARRLVIAVIFPSSVIPLKKGVNEWIKEAINKKMLRHGFLIGMADEQLDVDVNRMLSYLQKQGPLSEPHNLIIGQFFPEIPVVNDAILLHYRERNKTKSLIEGVNPKELLVEYIFPKSGRNGRGCDGVPIVVPEPTVKYAKSIKIDDETIYTIEDKKSIRYYAKVSGFVKFERGHLSISQTLSLKSLSMKKTGSIDVGTDKQISLVLNQKVYREDAVGMGVNIDIQKVDITGTVGENTKIKADELRIGAQTHRKSTMDVSGVANIQLHRGNLKAKEANIDMLEGGRVEADVVHIKKMLGGEVIGRKVYVDVLYSHGKIIALESIEVNTIEGEGNALIIDPYSVSAYHEKIAQTKAVISEKESAYQLTKKELSEKQAGFKQKNMQITQFKHRITRAKANGMEPMSVDVARIREYEAQGHKLHHKEGKLREEAQYIAALHDKLNKLYEADLEGVVLCHDVYNGHNRVAFVDPKTRQEYSLFPRGAVKKIELKLHGDEKKMRLDY